MDRQYIRIQRYYAGMCAFRHEPCLQSECAIDWKRCPDRGLWMTTNQSLTDFKTGKQATGDRIK